MSESKELVLTNSGELTTTTRNKIIEIQEAIKSYEDELANIKDLILKEMERLGILRIECGDNIYIDYYPESEVKQFDVKEFKKVMPEVVEAYSKVVKKKAFIKIGQRKVKENKGETNE